MYSKLVVSPLQLVLDPKNPRFIIPETTGSQEDIRNYLITQEDVLPLSKSILENNGLMPGERIVICIEDGKYIVLEGNRRTCTCQMFLDRSLIPKGYEDKFPSTNEELKTNIENLEVDVIASREEAKRFLAVRHIQKTNGWSTIAKMRFCYEDYNNGNTIDQISDRTGISVSNVARFIREYKILIRGLNSKWTQEEKTKLNLLDLKPDKLLRMFRQQDARTTLGLYFNDKYDLYSKEVSDADLDEIIHIFTKEAFVNDELNTRSDFGTYKKDGTCTGACIYIKHILDKYNNSSTDSGESDNNHERDNGENNNGDGNKPKDESENRKDEGGNSGTNKDNTEKSNNTEKDSNTGDSGDNESGDQQQEEQQEGGGPKNLTFFSTLNWKNVDPKDSQNRGIISVCGELRKISRSNSFISNYPICTAFIIRSLIEQTLKYYARKNAFWKTIKAENNKPGTKAGEPSLSFIIKQYNKNINAWAPDPEIQRLFNIVFNSAIQTDKLNLVVHSPESYSLAPETLKAIPDEGLLKIVNYMLK